MYSLKTENRLHWEAHSDSQQPSTQELIRDSRQAKHPIGSSLPDFGVVLYQVFKAWHQSGTETERQEFAFKMNEDT